MIMIDIEMPKKCCECPCFHAEYPMHCQLIKPPDKNKRLVAPYGLPRPDWCPLLKEQEPKKPIQRPPLKELESELQRERYKIRYRRVLRSTVFTLVTVAAIAILVATLCMPVLQIYGASMTPTLTDGDIVISRKVRNLKQGDIVAFYYNNRILVKRYIANAGDWVDIDEDGNVYVNGELLNEPYVYEKALGECNIELPYQVPENRIFVLGDHRSVSIDSRSSSVGCVAEDQIVGELVCCVWPFSNLGVIR